MKAVIIEDEKKNSQQLRSLLTKNCPDVFVVGEGYTADAGIDLIREKQPDIVFLDIQMPGKSGFDMLTELGNYPFEVIFVTGYDQYGIEAIKFSALDYLLKPVKPVELVQAVDKATRSSSRKHMENKILNLLDHLENTDKDDHQIALAFAKETRFVYVRDIVRCESHNSYTTFHMSNGESLMLSYSLYNYDMLLRPYHFIRCHQSHLVNRKFISSLKKEDSIPELLLLNGSTVPVSRKNYDMVKKELLKQR